MYVAMYRQTHHVARQDITGNMVKLEELTAKLKPELLLLESGGDNLAANFSRFVFVAAPRMVARPAHASLRALSVTPQECLPPPLQCTLVLCSWMFVGVATGASLS